mmetsp:Transcript_27765/g.90867  ORF Transcript_27765/g.90867 Transcript_27765/m.90867 type:complete len:325 (+) Transcript_27765:1147-2121(+)
MVRHAEVLVARVLVHQRVACQLELRHELARLLRGCGPVRVRLPHALIECAADALDDCGFDGSRFCHQVCPDALNLRELVLLPVPRLLLLCILRLHHHLLLLLSGRSRASVGRRSKSIALLFGGQLLGLGRSGRSDAVEVLRCQVPQLSLNLLASKLYRALEEGRHEGHRSSARALHDVRPLHLRRRRALKLAPILVRQSETRAVRQTEQHSRRAMRLRIRRRVCTARFAVHHTFVVARPALRHLSFFFFFFFCLLLHRHTITGGCINSTQNVPPANARHHHRLGINLVLHALSQAMRRLNSHADDAPKVLVALQPQRLHVRQRS